MMKNLKWWLALGGVLIFFAGVALGLFAGAWHARHNFVVRHGGHFHDRMREHVRRELGLSSEQNEKVGPILDRLFNRLGEIRKETDQHVGEAMTAAHEEIVPFLTPAQREKLEKMRQRHHRLLRMRAEHGPHSPPPSPPAP